jgi:peroxiredoxin/outer membrane protein assembly factor BamD (BamD/ComL family)
MWQIIGILVLLCISPSVLAQDKSEGPSNEKAQKTYKEAEEYLHRRMIGSALDDFKKADKQDDGHCRACQQKMIRYGIEIGEWKIAESAAEEVIAQAQGNKDIAIAHYQLGVVLYTQGIKKNKDELFARAHEEFIKALAAAANFPDAIFSDGQSLAHMGQYDQAKERFAAFAKMRPADDPDRQRALRYVDQPELARARMAPAFAVTLVDGQRITLDDLKGKVVLIDFWATWCAPCREALPHIRDLTRKFQGEPFVVLSVSLDDDEQKWKDFISKNEMTWHQCRAGGFKGPVAQLFGVTAIPNTFTIDADGVLQDQHIGDASIEGKIKKLVKRARELQDTSKPAQVAN